MSAVSGDLYRRDDVVRELNLGESIYVVPDESDAEALWRHGAVGTCVPGGLSRWRKGMTATLSTAADVFLVIRGESGLAPALRVKEKLADEVGDVSIVRVARGKCVADHLAAGLGLDDLVPVEGGVEPDAHEPAGVAAPPDPEPPSVPERDAGRPIASDSARPGAGVSQVPPQAPEAEENLLGALFVSGALGFDASRGTVGLVAETGIDAAEFYRESHGLIFRCRVALVARGEPSDVTLVIAELQRRGQLEQVGGMSRIHELAALAPTTRNAPHHARLVVEKARQRTLLRELGPIVEKVWNGGIDPEEALDRLERARKTIEPTSTAAALAPVELATLLSGPPPETQWSWEGWLARGDLAQFAGDPKVGKSWLVLGLAQAVRTGGKLLGARCARARVGIFDLENPLGEAHKRLRAIGLTAQEHEGLVYFHGPVLDLSAGSGLLAATVEAHELDLVIIDSLRRAAPALDENDSRAVSQVMSPLRALTLETGLTIVVVHHARKRVGDNPTDAGQMVRGSGDLVASVDTLLYLRARESGAFTLEHAASRRGLPHESILVRIQGDGDRVELVNEGPVATADDKVEGMLARIVAALREERGPLARQVLALRVGADPKDGTFGRALNLGWQRGLLAKTNEETRKANEPLLYALAEVGYE